MRKNQIKLTLWGHMITCIPSNRGAKAWHRFLRYRREKNDCLTCIPFGPTTESFKIMQKKLRDQEFTLLKATDRRLLKLLRMRGIVR